MAELGTRIEVLSNQALGRSMFMVSGTASKDGGSLQDV
jgi:hypothetical protein